MKLRPLLRSFALIPFTLAFICGIMAGFHLPLAPEWLLPAAGSGALLLLLSRRLLRSSHLPLHGAGFLLGFLLISEAVQPPVATDIFHLFPHKREAVLLGTMAEMPMRGERTTAAVIACEGVRFKEEKHFHPVSGKALVRLEGDWPQQLAPGDRLVVRADFKRPQGNRTAGTFDYPFYLAVEGITLTGFARSRLYFARLPQRLQHTPEPLMWVQRLRMRLARAIDKALPTEQAGLFRALLLGDRSGVSPGISESLKAAGVFHISAISGLHLGAVATLFYLLFYFLLSRSERLLLTIPVHLTAVCATLPPLLFYAALAGMNPPVMRALVMVLVVALAAVLRRVTSPSTLLAAAALLLLACNPLRLFTASFLLSFAAVGSIFLLLPAVQPLTWKQPSRVKTIGRRLLATLLLSVGISACTAPLTILTFHRFSFIGPLANLVVEPLLCLLALPLGLLALPFLLLWPALGQLLLHLAALPLQAGLLATQWLATLPGASMWVAAALPWFQTGCLLFYCGLGLTGGALALMRWRGDTVRQALPRLLPGGILLLLSTLLFFHSGEKRSRIVFFDVGQGSSTLLETAAGETLLVDGGGGFFNRELGQRTLAPFLWSSGISRLDAIVATHSDRDHTQALPFLLRTFKPKVLYLRETEEKNRQVEKMRRAAAGTGTVLRSPTSLESVLPGISCVANFGAPHGTKVQQRLQRNRGVVLLVRFEGLSLLLPGDIDRAAEQQLLHLPHSTVLLAAHHGSKTSNSPALLDQLAPPAVFASCGDRPGIFPSTRLVKELARRQIPLYTTNKMGTMELVKEREGWGIFHLVRPGENPFRPPVQRRIGTIKTATPRKKAAVTTDAPQTGLTPR